MAPMIFAKSILNSKPIKIFNFGKMTRDFTYIDDISESIFRCSLKKAISNKSFNNKDPDPSTSSAPHIILNIGSNKPIQLLDFIEILENHLGKKAIKDFQPIQPGDVKNTFAEVSKLEKWINFTPNTSFEIGIQNFAKWYKNYYGY